MLLIEKDRGSSDKTNIWKLCTCRRKENNMTEEFNKKEEGCHCGCHHHHTHEHEHEHEDGCKCSEKFLVLADEAWREVLKEKIKDKILAKKGEHIEKLAELIAKANGERWKNKIYAKTNNNKFKDSLKELFSSSD